jgi:hypothetical protein
MLGLKTFYRPSIGLLSPLLLAFYRLLSPRTTDPPYPLAVEGG